MQDYCPERFLGAGGRMAVIVEHGARTAVGPARPSYRSCTVVRARLQAVEATLNSPLRSASAVVLRCALRRLHPSVVYVCAEDAALGELITGELGYTTLTVDEHGATNTLVGIAADPVFGWPGDYRL